METKQPNPTSDGKMPSEFRGRKPQIQSHLSRIFVPLRDRSEMHIEVPAARIRDITGSFPRTVGLGDGILLGFAPGLPPRSAPSPRNAR